MRSVCLEAKKQLDLVRLVGHPGQQSHIAPPATATTATTATAATFTAASSIFICIFTSTPPPLLGCQCGKARLGRADEAPGQRRGLGVDLADGDGPRAEAAEEVTEEPLCPQRARVVVGAEPLNGGDADRPVEATGAEGEALGHVAAQVVCVATPWRCVVGGGG